jgi:polysaccharide export outer membrane protein
MKKWLFILLGAFFLASCGTKELRVHQVQLPAGTPDPAKPTDEFYVIGPGDALDIVVWKEAVLSGPVKVRPDGFITLPLINEVQVSGMTTGQLRKVLEDKYRQFVTSPFVSVRVASIASSEIFVIGEVNKPGSYPAMGKDTILQMLIRAGGLTIFADRSNIKLARRDGSTVTEYIVDYDAIVRGDLRQDLLLRPGDRIIVP